MFAIFFIDISIILVMISISILGFFFSYWLLRNLGNYDIEIATLSVFRRGLLFIGIQCLLSALFYFRLRSVGFEAGWVTWVQGFDISAIHILLTLPVFMLGLLLLFQIWNWLLEAIFEVSTRSRRRAQAEAERRKRLEQEDKRDRFGRKVENLVVMTTQEKRIRVVTNIRNWSLISVLWIVPAMAAFWLAKYLFIESRWFQYFLLGMFDPYLGWYGGIYRFSTIWVNAYRIVSTYLGESDLNFLATPAILIIIFSIWWYLVEDGVEKMV